MLNVVLTAGNDPDDRRRGDYGDLDGSCQPMTPMTPNSGCGGGSPKIKTEGPVVSLNRQKMLLVYCVAELVCFYRLRFFWIQLQNISRLSTICNTFFASHPLH